MIDDVVREVGRSVQCRFEACEGEDIGAEGPVEVRGRRCRLDDGEERAVGDNRQHNPIFSPHRNPLS